MSSQIDGVKVFHREYLVHSQNHGLLQLPQTLVSCVCRYTQWCHEKVVNWDYIIIDPGVKFLSTHGVI